MHECTYIIMDTQINSDGDGDGAGDGDGVMMTLLMVVVAMWMHACHTRRTNVGDREYVHGDGCKYEWWWL